MKSNPKVSILCLAYNQERYIKQALDSFFMQKTDFDFEVIIHDDASTDNTVKIIKEYQKKYPGKIKAVFQKENQLSKGVRGAMIKFLLPRISGEYIANCDGDDFFTDSSKLQLQADFLDNNPDYAICFHSVRVFFDNKAEKDLVYPKLSDGLSFTVEELLRLNYIPANSVMYRKQDYAQITNKNITPGDWYLHLYHAQFGKIGFINKVMSAYRRHSGGIWWDSLNNIDSLIKKHGVGQMIMYFELLKLYGNKKEYVNIIYKNIEDLFSHFIIIDRKDISSHLIQDSFKSTPELIDVYFDEILKNQEKNGKAMSKEQLSQIKSSKFFALWQKYCDIKKVFINHGK